EPDAAAAEPDAAAAEPEAAAAEPDVAAEPDAAAAEPDAAAAEPDAAAAEPDAAAAEPDAAAAKPDAAAAEPDAAAAEPDAAAAKPDAAAAEPDAAAAEPDAAAAEPEAAAAEPDVAAEPDAAAAEPEAAAEPGHVPQAGGQGQPEALPSLSMVYPAKLPTLCPPKQARPSAISVIPEPLTPQPPPSCLDLPPVASCSSSDASSPLHRLRSRLGSAFLALTPGLSPKGSPHPTLRPRPPLSPPSPSSPSSPSLRIARSTGRLAAAPSLAASHSTSSASTLPAVERSGASGSEQGSGQEPSLAVAAAVAAAAPGQELLHWRRLGAGLAAVGVELSPQDWLDLQPFTKVVAKRAVVDCQALARALAPDGPEMAPPLLDGRTSTQRLRLHLRPAVHKLRRRWISDPPSYLSWAQLRDQLALLGPHLTPADWYDMRPLLSVTTHANVDAARPLPLTTYVDWPGLVQLVGPDRPLPAPTPAPTNPHASLRAAPHTGVLLPAPSAASFSEGGGSDPVCSGPRQALQLLRSHPLAHAVYAATGGLAAGPPLSEAGGRKDAGALPMEVVSWRAFSRAITAHGCPLEETDPAWSLLQPWMHTHPSLQTAMIDVAGLASALAPDGPTFACALAQPSHPSTHTSTATQQQGGGGGEGGQRAGREGHSPGARARLRQLLGPVVRAMFPGPSLEEQEAATTTPSPVGLPRLVWQDGAGAGAGAVDLPLALKPKRRSPSTLAAAAVVAKAAARGAPQQPVQYVHWQMFDKVVREAAPAAGPGGAESGAAGEGTAGGGGAEAAGAGCMTPQL
ncbi:hypothetical protein QJQ45_027415, partial [Haematococcus lacustris]